MLGSLFLPVVLGAGVAGMGVAYLSWLRRDRPGAVPLTGFLVAASCWALVQGLQLAAGDLGATRLWARVGLVLSAVIPLAWLLTVLEFTGRDRWLTRPRLAGLARSVVDDESVEQRLARIVDSAEDLARRSKKVGRLTWALERDTLTASRLDQRGLPQPSRSRRIAISNQGQSRSCRYQRGFSRSRS